MNLLLDPFWTHFGTFLGHLLGQKMSRGTPERAWKEILAADPKKFDADPKKFVADPKKYRAKWGFPWFLEASRGRLWGALVRFLVQSVSKKGAKRMSERGQKGAEK